jgi:hypothetical protein
MTEDELNEPRPSAFAIAHRMLGSVSGPGADVSSLLRSAR